MYAKSASYEKTSAQKGALEKGMIRFVYQKNSPLNAETQIKEQIKVALLLGHLRPRDTLPSIRDVEKELGISRNIVRKAYVHLEELGILTLIQGKGALVNEEWKYGEDEEFLSNCEQLVKSVFAECLKISAVPSSFARFLYQKAVQEELKQPLLTYLDMTEELAEMRAEQIAGLLHVGVAGLALDCCTDESVRQLKNRFAKFPLLTNYYRLEQARQTFKGTGVEVVPLRMQLAEKTRKELESLPTGSKVVFIFDERDQSGLSLILEDYRESFESLEFEARTQKELDLSLKDNHIAKLLISNRLWNALDQKTKEMEKITFPVMEFDPASVEESKIHLGLIS